MVVMALAECLLDLLIRLLRRIEIPRFQSFLQRLELLGNLRFLRLQT
jgi:hypothetical protein